MATTTLFNEVTLTNAYAANVSSTISVDDDCLFYVTWTVGAGSSGLELVLQFEHDGQFFTPAASVGEMRPTWSTPPGATTPTRIVIPMAEVFGTPAVGVARLPVGKTEAARRVRVLARVAGTAGGTLKLEAVT